MWLLPSRGRPHLVQRLLTAGVGIREPGLLILDKDDAGRYDKIALPLNWRRVVIDRTHLSAKLNEGFRRYPKEAWYGVLNDDHLPKTAGWEAKVIEAAGTSGMAWPHDNYAMRISSHVKGGDLVRLLGWFVCPAIKHFWLDDVDELIAPLVGGRFLSDVVVSHEHVNAGRMPVDSTYLERPSNKADKAAFDAWKLMHWPGLAERLKATVQ